MLLEVPSCCYSLALDRKMIWQGLEFLWYGHHLSYHNGCLDHIEIYHLSSLLYLVLSRMLIFILLRLRTKNPKNKNKYILFPSENIIMKIFSSYISNIKAENMINRELYIYNICIYHTETRLLFKEN